MSGATLRMPTSREKNKRPDLEVADPISIPATGSAPPQANLVSVVIPCYNHARFLAHAIESVLAQSYSNFELVVVDDGSTDDTSKVAKGYSMLNYVYQENAGRSTARNTGLRLSRAEFIVFLDADDRLLPNALETGINCMHEHPECALVSGHCRVIDSNGAILPSPRQQHVEQEHYLQLLRGGSYIWCPAVAFFQRKVFDFVHGFDPALMPVEDYDLYLRITKDFPVYSHNRVIAEYRQHGSNTSRDVTAMEHAALAAHKAQWDLVKANSQYREAYYAGQAFWQNDYPLQRMVSRIREIVREQLPSDAIVAVATSGNSELLRLNGRQAWHFPQMEEGGGTGQLFAQGPKGSVETPGWIEAGMTYVFSLYGGTERSKLLARLLVRGVADPVPIASDEPMPEDSAHEDGVLLTAIPNPVSAGEEPGVTNITWSTADGSEGQLYVSSVGVYAGRDPANSNEALRFLESIKAKGAEYLVIPAKSFWWLDDYQEFRRHVEADYRAVVRDDNTCIIFHLLNHGNKFGKS